MTDQVKEALERLTEDLEEGWIYNFSTRQAVQTLLAELSRLSKLVEEATGGDGWQPIETAPEDGTRVLVTRGAYTGRPPTKIAWRYAGNPYPGWRIGLNKRLRYHPTLWRPLPQPPRASLTHKTIKGNGDV